MIRIENDKPALYQWDLDRRVELLNLKAGVEVHFEHSKEVNDSCPVVISYEENGRVFANIPNVFLQRSGIIVAYVYIDAHTEYHTEILVLSRSKPSDYVYTETETLTWASLDNRIRMLEEKPESNVAQSDFEAKQNEEGHILNRPMNRTVNYTNVIENVDVGSYCIYDFRNYPGSNYKNYLTVEGLANATSEISYALTYEGMTSRGWYEINFNFYGFKPFDGVNLKQTINTMAARLTEIYCVQDYTLLSDELKEKMPHNGVWIVVTGTGAKDTLRNFTLKQYYHTKLSANYLPKETVMQKVMENYVDNALANVPTGGGEKWETIVDYTVPEDCSQVLLTTDINGNPFSLKKAVAYFVLHPIADPSAAAAIRYAFDSSVGAALYNKQHFWGAAEAPKNAGKATACRFELTKTNEGVIATVRAASGEFAIGTDDVQLKTYACCERFHQGTLITYATGIDAVGVGSYKTAVGAGTRIKLLGVRE